MVRLRRSSPDDPGWTRRRAGKGFVYLDGDGERLSDEDAQRVKDLVIPPAWQDVWVCRWPNGHLQAVGTDDAGRRQYLYHPDWRVRRDSEKFARMLEFGRALSKAREQVLVDLGAEGMSQERACAVAVRLLDLGYFRIGNDVYADAERQLRAHHAGAPARAQGGRHADLRFTGKSGDRPPHRDRRPGRGAGARGDAASRGGDDRLLAWKDGRRWRSLDSSLVNDYVRHDRARRDSQGLPHLARHGDRGGRAGRDAEEMRPRRKAARKRAEVAAMKEVAEFLGNTPALARSSYVDPRVIDAFEEGRTIGAANNRRLQDGRRPAGGARASRAPAAEGGVNA